MVDHSKDFYSFHRHKHAQLAKCAKVPARPRPLAPGPRAPSHPLPPPLQQAKSSVDSRRREGEREEEREERRRLKALRENDMEAYAELVAKTKNERLRFLLEQTDAYLAELGACARCAAGGGGG